MVNNNGMVSWYHNGLQLWEFKALNDPKKVTWGMSWFWVLGKDKSSVE